MILKSPDVVRKALPITLREFRRSLISSWELHTTWQKAPITLGLAISGGVDSMALASLCVRMQDENWRFRAFVVDHGARTGSDKEAYEVAELVTKQGIETTVLKIKWPKDIIPSRSSKFESLARRYRYRILGKACRDSGIRNLLLAHHENDQYETLMMRLAKGHKGPGLLGMKASSRIPECDGIFGVYGSGAVEVDFINVPVSKLGIFKEPGKSFTSGNWTESIQSPLPSEPNDDQFKQQEEGYTMKWPRGELIKTPSSRPLLEPMQVEHDFIRVLRPLLLYSKDRLIATCRHGRTSWVEDITNADPTFTQRNALRHIFKKHTLPAALQKNSILALSSRLRRKDDLLDREALSLLDQHSAWSFEPRAGALLIRFPKLMSIENDGVGEEHKIAVDHNRRDVAWRLLRYAIKAVSPTEGVQFQRLDKLSSYIYPELNLRTDHRGKPPNCFTIAGVMFQRKEVSNLQLTVPGTAGVGQDNTCQNNTRAVEMQDCGWLISRQPYESSLERQPLIKYSPTIFTNKYSGWRYYDGRYWIWIRVPDQSSDYIKVRPFREEDLQAFNNLDFRARQTILHRLKTIAPGPIRFTLPVIVRPKAESDEKEMVLALPTLGISVPGAEEFMEYDIRYKEVLWPRL